jgi:hypothetical protein
MAHIWATVFSRTRNIFAVERLERTAPAHPAPLRRSLLRLLVTPEPLARDAELPARPRRSWLRLLLAIERLEHAPAPAPSARVRWTRRLFTVERLDPP